MRDETSEWLEPLLTEARSRNIDVQPLMTAATMPAAEAGSQFLDWLTRNVPDGAVTRGLDWIRFGQLVRHELGWDDAYPAYPDFPEARDTP